MESATFADDLKAFTNEGEKFQQTLDAVYNWSTRRKLPLNTGKVVILPVGHVTPDTTFVLNGEPARQEAVVKDLGVKISGDLKWNSQVEYVCAKSRSRSGILLRNFRHLSSGRLMYLFNGLVRPILE